jgi:hypothetical protein
MNALYDKFLSKFKLMSDKELLETYENDRGHSGWVGARGQFLAALRKEFENRNYIYPTLKKKKSNQTSLKSV